MLLGSDHAADIGEAPVEAAEESPRVLMLSGFDEYVFGYGDRSAIPQPEQVALVVPGNNGVFRPTIIDDGTIVGASKRKVTTKRVDITPEPFALRPRSPWSPGLSQSWTTRPIFGGVRPAKVSCHADSSPVGP